MSSGRFSKETAKTVAGPNDKVTYPGQRNGAHGEKPGEGRKGPPPNKLNVYRNCVGTETHSKILYLYSPIEKKGAEISFINTNGGAKW